MPRYFVAYRKTEEAGQKPEWASFTTESPAALEAHAIRERVDKRLGLFGERLTGAGEVQFLGSAPARRVPRAPRGGARRASPSSTACWSRGSGLDFAHSAAFDARSRPGPSGSAVMEVEA